MLARSVSIPHCYLSEAQNNECVGKVGGNPTQTAGCRIMESLGNTYALLGSGELFGLDALLFVSHCAAVRDSLWGRYVWCLLVGWTGSPI